MSIKNAPPKWASITAIASRLGVAADTQRKWLEPGRGIPPAWKLRIFEQSNGAISFKDMEIKVTKTL